MRETLTLRQEQADTIGIVEALEVMVFLAVTQQPERAVRLLAVTEQTRQAVCVPRQPNETKELDHALAAACNVLVPAALSALWNEGALWTLEQAYAYALAHVQEHESGSDC